MAQQSKIEWTSATWNPVTGCSKISAGCAHCYAETMAKRLKAMGNPRYIMGFDIVLHHDLIELPLSWREPRMVFVNSMSDLFHENVPVDFIRQVFATIEQADRHIFQVLTKRAERLQELALDLPWPKNLWMGVTVECQSCISRIERLKKVPAAVKFISAEPLIGPLEIDLTDIDWLIVGGESGPGARLMRPEWVRDLKEGCLQANVPFFFKQWGGVNKKRAGRALDGEIWGQYPAQGAQMSLIV